MRHEEITVNSIHELLAALRKTTDHKEIVWFRGQSRSEWGLIPSLSRNPNHLTRETELIKRFMQLAVPHLTEDAPTTDWEWIFLMQHHRVPTRLLDWTESPLAAAWFAVSSQVQEDKECDAAFWCLAPLSLNRESKLRGRLDSELPGFGFGMDSVLDNYLPEKQDTGAGQNPVAATGSRNSRRMAAQLGNFTIFDRGSEAIENVGTKDHIWRFIIPAKSKDTILEELRLLRFTELTLFPDLDRVAQETQELLK